jgi:hypothetical protein
MPRPARISRWFVLSLWAALFAGTGGASAQERVVGWGPSRDEAVVVDEAVIGSGLRTAAGYEELPAPERRLMAPRPARLMPRSTRVSPESYIEGPITTESMPVPGQMHEGMIVEGETFPAGDCASCLGVSCGGCGQCPDCCGNWNSCGPVPVWCLLPRPRLDNLELHAGVHGFTGPLNRGASGSFGFHQGFNHAIPLCGEWACGQFGAMWTQSNYDGSFVAPDDQRNQIFFSTGLFRRVDWGLQGGIVFDYLHDEWDYEADLGQLRGELGWKFACRHEVGFRFSFGVNDDTITINEPITSNDGDQLTLRERDAIVEVNDLYVFYYRRQFACGGEGRMFGGFTNNNQGVFGGDARLPINPCWSLTTDFVYVVPSDESVRPGYAEESWNVSVGVVWTPFAKPGCSSPYCRPLFDVANNGTFLTRLP